MLIKFLFIKVLCLCEFVYRVKRVQLCTKWWEKVCRLTKCYRKAWEDSSGGLNQLYVREHTWDKNLQHACFICYRRNSALSSNNTMNGSHSPCRTEMLDCVAKIYVSSEFTQDHPIWVQNVELVCDLSYPYFVQKDESDLFQYHAQWQIKSR